MSEDVIRNIRISVSTETSKSQGNLANLLQTLKEIQTLTNSISFPSKKVTALATSLSKLRDFKIGSDFTNSIKTLKDGMKDINSVITSPKKTEAAAAWIKAIADVAHAEAKKMEAETSRMRLEYKKQRAIVRDQYNQAKLLQSQAKEARLSQPRVSSTSRRGSQTAVVPDAVERVHDIDRSVSQLSFAFMLLKQSAGTAAIEIAKVFAPLTIPIAAVGNAFAKLGTTIVSTLSPAIQAVSSKVSAIKNTFVTLGSTISTNVSSAVSSAGAAIKQLSSHIATCHPRLVSFAKWLRQVAVAGVSVANVLVKTGYAILAVGRAAASVAVSAIKKLGSVAASAAKPMATLAAKIPFLPFKNLGKHVKDLTTKFTGFLASIKRIALYRAIRSVLKEITQAFKEGTDNLYQYSKAINGVFAQSMDSLATSALYAKNSLAAMASPLINALAPAVDFIVDKFVDFINTINQLIATLTGAQTWTKALKYPKEYAEAADGANGKAKELRATLLGFDEINRLDDNRKGSRGSAAEELDYSKMFEEQTVSSNVKSLAKRIKDAFLEGDFYDLGSELGKKIRDGLNDIPWDSIQDRIRKNAMSAATFINGIVDTEGLPEALGETLADAFNTVTLKIKTFFNEVKWKKVGKAVGDTLSTAVSKIDVQQLGDALWSVLSAAVDTALGMIESNPIIGTAAVIGIGMRYGGLLGTNMATGIAGSGLTSKISGLIPTTAKIAITAAVMFKIGNYLYDNVGWIQDLADKLTEGWNQFWDTDAYHAVADFWAKTNGLADEYYQRTSIAESQKQWLMRQGYTESEAYHALMAKERVDQTEDAKKLRELLGKQNSEFLDMIHHLKDIKGLTEDEEEALRKLIIQDWIIRFETKFGKTPQEMAQEWMDNLKTKLQPVADALKKAGGDWGKAIKDGLLSIFTGDSIKNQIKKSLPTRIEVTAVANDSRQTIHAIKAYAGGGDPVTGSMFIAGERGAELVSSSSNGTSVYNRNQIADSVASGNEQTVAALNELISIGQALLEKNNDITTDSISNALSRSNLRAGRTVVVTGG